MDAPVDDSRPAMSALLAALDALIADVRRQAATRLRSWPPVPPGFEASAANLAAYLAMRSHDLRPLQRGLMAWGLSSLGRLESRVMPALEAVRASVAAIAASGPAAWPSPHDFFAGERELGERTDAILGERHDGRPVRLLVTCPSEAADDPGFMLELALRGVDAVRINCAHDDAPAWQRMVEHARHAEHETGQRLRVFMDLAGPKIRSGRIQLPSRDHRVRSGDAVAVVVPGALERAPAGLPAMECTLPSAVLAMVPGQHLFYDDGKFGARVEQSEAWGVVARVARAPDKGVRLKPEKGLNFPETRFEVDALTDKDIADLAFVARHADGVEYSFVQSPADVQRLQRVLAECAPDDWQRLALVLKIETLPAVERLPELLVQAAKHQPVAVMIARGDLAVEIGFTRMAEMQEEMLWLAEAARVPVIWATQVLEHLVTKGMPLRGEMTDAAMAARAECVMLNKGPYLLDAIDALDQLLERMSIHQVKKTPQLRALSTWTRAADDTA